MRLDGKTSKGMLMVEETQMSYMIRKLSSVSEKSTSPKSNSDHCDASRPDACRLDARVRIISDRR